MPSEAIRGQISLLSLPPCHLYMHGIGEQQPPYIFPDCLTNWQGWLRVSSPVAARRTCTHDLDFESKAQTIRIGLPACGSQCGVSRHLLSAGLKVKS